MQSPARSGPALHQSVFKPSTPCDVIHAPDLIRGLAQRKKHKTKAWNAIALYCEIGGVGGPVGAGCGVEASAAGGVGFAAGVAAVHGSELFPDAAVAAGDDAAAGAAV
jgi:hypothetical protein